MLRTARQFGRSLSPEKQKQFSPKDSLQHVLFSKSFISKENMWPGDALGREMLVIFLIHMYLLGTHLNNIGLFILK